jgi:hypothetical protein
MKQGIAKYRFNRNEMHCGGKLKLIAYNARYGLIEVDTKAGLTHVEQALLILPEQLSSPPSPTSFLGD